MSVVVEQRLSDLARHVVEPSGVVSTGWPAVKAKCRDMGVPIDRWQDGIGRLALAKRADGKYACTIGGVVLSIPRQVGKSHLLGGITFALCLLHPRLTVVWTAQRLKTAEETFGSMQGMAKRKRVAPYVRRVATGSGKEAVYFRNGSRILFGARDFGFGRGFAKIDVLIFDEAQHLSMSTLEDMIPATNRSQQPAGALVFYAGTPPRPQDKGEAFRDMRTEALGGRLDDMAYVEFSADRDADPDDLEQLAKANPSFPRHTPLESILRMRRQLRSDAGFLREGMGIWGAAPGSVIDSQSWADLADDDSMAVADLALAVDVSEDRKHASIAVAGRREDDRWHVELVESSDADERSGVGWVPDYLGALLAANEGRVRALVVESAAPAQSLIDELAKRKIRVVKAATRDVQAATAQLVDAVDQGRLRHIGQTQLATALSVARKRSTPDGLWTWNRKTATADITPLTAATLALWGAQRKASGSWANNSGTGGWVM